MFSALNLRIGFFLEIRKIKRASLWTTGLIVFVMVLTFLNLVVVSGVLVGIVQGSIDSHRTQDTGDVIVSSLDDKKYIENSPEVIGIIKSLPKVKDASARYRLGGTLEANYKTRKDTDKPNIAVTQIIGIDPVAENNVSNMSKNIIKGEYLSPDDYDQIVLGSLLLEEDFSFNALFATLKNVSPGVKIRVNVNGVQREVTVKGVFESKVQDISRNAYMIDSQFRSIIGRNDGNVSEIAIKLNQGIDPKEVSEALVLSGVDEVAKIKTYYEAQPQFLKDVIKTFGMLGNMLSSIGLVVASITIFIVIFINAITRRKFIGILKGIGINGEAETKVLKGIDFKTENGEFVAIMGRSGAGKSTFLYLMSLLDEPTSGEIIIDSKDAHKMTAEEKTLFRLEKCGYVFQDYALLPDLRSEENVALPLLMQNIGRKKAYAKAKESLIKVNLGHRFDNLPSHLSGGEQQRVSIARAVAHKPKILFADEPTANLDNESSAAVVEIFKELHQAGQTKIGRASCRER